MAARLDPFLDVFLREGAEQLYLLPDEPVTMVKGGKPRKVSKQPLTDAHIYALLAEIAPSDSADKIDQKHETEFEYAAGRGLLKIRIGPDHGRLTAVVTHGAIAAPLAAPDPPPAAGEVTAVRPAPAMRPAPPPSAEPTPPPPHPPLPPRTRPGPWWSRRWRLRRRALPARCRESSPTRNTRPPSSGSASCSGRWSSRGARTCICGSASPRSSAPAATWCASAATRSPRRSSTSWCSRSCRS